MSFFYIFTSDERWGLKFQLLKLVVLLQRQWQQQRQWGWSQEEEEEKDQEVCQGGQETVKRGIKPFNIKTELNFDTVCYIPVKEFCLDIVANCHKFV